MYAAVWLSRDHHPRELAIVKQHLPRANLAKMFGFGLSNYSTEISGFRGTPGRNGQSHAHMSAHLWLLRLFTLKVECIGTLRKEHACWPRTLI